MATTDPFKQVAEFVGCGPFRFIAGRVTFPAAARSSRGSTATCRGRRRPSYTRRRASCAARPGGMAGHSRPRDGGERACRGGRLGRTAVARPDADAARRRRRDDGLLDIYGTVGTPAAQLHPRPDRQRRGAPRDAGRHRPDRMHDRGDGGRQTAWRAPIGFFVPGMPAANDAGMEMCATASRRRGEEDAGGEPATSGERSC